MRRKLGLVTVTALLSTYPAHAQKLSLSVEPQSYNQMQFLEYTLVREIRCATFVGKDVATRRTQFESAKKEFEEEKLSWEQLKTVVAETVFRLNIYELGLIRGIRAGDELLKEIRLSPEKVDDKYAPEVVKLINCCGTSYKGVALLTEDIGEAIILFRGEAGRKEVNSLVIKLVRQNAKVMLPSNAE